MSPAQPSPPRDTAASRDPASHGEIQALLGEGTSYEGKLAFGGRVRIDGTFKGEVEGDGVLILGEKADLTATIRVGALIMRGGKLRGDVRATRSVELHPGAELRGDIYAPEIFIAKGTTFEGRCTMDAATTHELVSE